MNMFIDIDKDCFLESKHVLFNSTANLTIVTAFFDIGSFRKGLREYSYQENYIQWIRAYTYVLNPVIMYTDSEEFANRFAFIRRNIPDITKIIKIDRKRLWSFKIYRRIKEIFSLHDYPQFYPNTVNPDYSAVQHSKYELVSKAIKTNIFKNAFYAWIDIGYFRDTINSRRYSEIIPPRDFDRSKVAVNQIFEYNTNLTLSEIFRGNHVWVGGGMFIGTPDILKHFEQIYKRAVFYFLNKNLMNTDQQILYGIYHRDGKNEIEPSIALQVYKPTHYSGDPWFYLGYHCKILSKSWKCSNR